jgi:hypothetical protein
MNKARMFAGAVALILAGQGGEARAAQALVADTRTGCKLLDLHAGPGRSVMWSGDCVNGLAAGPGTADWYVGGRHEAHWTVTMAAGIAQGEGEIAWEGGRRYQGGLKDGKASGRGIHTWPTGRRYEGEWRDDKRTGRGTMFYPSGEQFLGLFEANRPLSGEYIAADGRQFIAWILPDGTIRAGEPLKPGTEAARSAPVAPRPLEAGRPAPVSSRSAVSVESVATPDVAPGAQPGGAPAAAAAADRQTGGKPVIGKPVSLVPPRADALGR